MDVETAPSGRATCIACRDRIPLGTKRLSVYCSVRGRDQTLHRCTSCATALLKDLLRELRGPGTAAH